MEDVLEVHHRPHDPARPVVCVDETSKQLIGETRVSIKAAPGRAKRFDYECRRNGTANLFMIFSPLEGWRRVEATDRHTAVDCAQVLKQLADVDFAAAEKIVLVQDNLNTHTPASLHQAFPAAEARRLVERFEWRYTPKHGSWLDMAESELAVCRPNVSIAASPTSSPSSRKSTPGKTSGTKTTPRPIGNSPLPTPALSSSAYTPHCERLGALQGRAQQGAGERAGVVQQDGFERSGRRRARQRHNEELVRDGEGPLSRPCPQPLPPSVPRDGDEQEAGEGSPRGGVSRPTGDVRQKMEKRGRMTG